MVYFEMSASTKSISASQASVRYGWNKRDHSQIIYAQSMKSSKNNPVDSNVHIDEFVVRGKEEGKPDRSYDSKKKKNRMYRTVNKILEYSL